MFSVFSISLYYFLLPFPLNNSVCNSMAFSFEQSSCCCPLSPALIIWNLNIKLQGERLLFPSSILNCYYIKDYLAVEPQITVFWQSSCVSNEWSLSMPPCIHLNHLFPSHISLWKWNICKWNICINFSILPNHGWIRNTGTVKQSILFEFIKIQKTYIYSTVNNILAWNAHDALRIQDWDSVLLSMLPYSCMYHPQHMTCDTLANIFVVPFHHDLF